MKIQKIVINVLLPFSLLIIFASLLTTKGYLILSEGYYQSHQDIEFDYDYASERIMGYLNYKYDDLLFGENENDDNVIMYDIEIRHMVDVKNVYTGLRIATGISLFLVVLAIISMYKKNKTSLYTTLKNIYRGPLLLIFGLGIVFAIDFDSAFTVFHKIFFTNDDWLLPIDSVLLQMLPLNFWMISAFIILGFFTIAILSISLLGRKLLK